MHINNFIYMAKIWKIFDFFLNMLNLFENSDQYLHSIIAELDGKTDPVQALDCLIDRRAEEANMGRWDYISTLEEIDGSHWSKIIKGKAQLTHKKLNLLCRRLCINDLEERIVRRLFFLHQIKSTADFLSVERISNRVYTRDDFAKFLASLGYMAKDLGDKSSFQDLVRKAIHGPRVTRRYIDAIEASRLICHAWEMKYFSLPNLIKEDCFVELLSNYAYIGYTMGSLSLFQQAMSALHNPAFDACDTGKISALKAHLGRRLLENFMGGDPKILYDLQAKAVNLITPKGLPKLGYMVANKIRLEIDMGLLEEAEPLRLKEKILACVADEHDVEKTAIAKSIYCRWLIKYGFCDDADALLAEQMTVLDNYLGKYDWARVTIREYQGLSAAQAFEQRRDIDIAERAVGFLSDALEITEKLSNTIVDIRLRTLRSIVLGESGLSIL